MFYKILPFILLVNFSFAQTSLELPKNEVILEVTGNISLTNEDDFAIFDADMIDQLPQYTINTSNHVSNNISVYTGINFYDLLKMLGFKGSLVNITAWDDYVVQIEIQDLKKYGVLLATHENGQRLTINDKGPMFVVFPFTDIEELRRDDYYNMSIWQVKEIDVE
ncbi:MAG: hypothetical protein HRU38_00125 [Saccharospirillaceae bacterium]|nr:hypothetical protein [Pseudomonadales bacterium]NRB77067.1 hypothetical protein [Saccharospirillaceae bacterium]